MDVGILLIVDGEPGRTLADFAVTARELESQGFSSLWVGEHVVTFPRYRPNYPYGPDGHPPFSPRQGWYDPLFALAAAASATTTLRLGTSILILPQRNPVVVAQEVVALDHLSRGRVRLGVGLGWSQEEYEACGVPWTRRGARFDEYIDAMTHLWQDELVTFEGEFVSFRDVVSLPKPIQQPRPPILIGGESGAAHRRAALRGDGWYGWAVPQEDVLPALHSLDAACEAAGRDPRNLTRTLGTFHTGDTKLFQGYLDHARDSGVDEMVVVPWDPDRATEEVIAEIGKLAGI